MMNPNYPNLELLEYKVKRLLLQDDTTVEELARIRKKNPHAHLDFEVIVFSQIWSNTCTGFDVMEDDSVAWGGQAFTKEYTSVFHELLTDTYIVCFGNRLCYKVVSANDKFYEDLNNRQMASLSEAKKLY